MPQLRRSHFRREGLFCFTSALCCIVELNLLFHGISSVWIQSLWCPRTRVSSCSLLRRGYCAEKRAPFKHVVYARKRQPTLETFAFEARLEDHCETPSRAYKHIAPLLREIALSLHPDEHFRTASAKLHIYDPFFCLGGTKKRLGRLGFDRVYNENEDFFDVANGLKHLDFDVLVTNPPFSDHHLSSLLEFSVMCQKPWMTIIPAPYIFKDYYSKALSTTFGSLGHLPFYVIPRKKYQFKTPAPLPPPPKNRAKARTRHRFADSIWVVHGGPGRELHARLLELARKNVALQDCTVVADIKEMPRDVAPPRFTVEMRRNAEQMEYRWD